MNLISIDFKENYFLRKLAIGFVWFIVISVCIPAYAAENSDNSVKDNDNSVKNTVGQIGSGMALGGAASGTPLGGVIALTGIIMEAASGNLSFGGLDPAIKWRIAVNTDLLAQFTTRNNIDANTDLEKIGTDAQAFCSELDSIAKNGESIHLSKTRLTKLQVTMPPEARVSPDSDDVAVPITKNPFDNCSKRIAFNAKQVRSTSRIKAGLDPADDNVYEFLSKPKAAVVYVFRDEFILKFHPVMIVSANVNESALLAKNKVVMFDVTPGKTSISCKLENGKDQLELETEAEKLYFIKAIPKNGWSRGCELEQVSLEEAQPAVKKAEYSRLHMFN